MLIGTSLYYGSCNIIIFQLQHPLKKELEEFTSMELSNCDSISPFIMDNVCDAQHFFICHLISPLVKCTFGSRSENALPSSRA